MKHILSTYRSALSLLVLLWIGTPAFAQHNTVEFNVNGLKVILRQTQKETVVMSMFFRGGSANYSAANAGIESLALSGTLECGTGAYPANAFNDQADEYGLHLAGEASNDYGMVKLSCISRYMDEAWKLFSSAITAPAFEPQKFALLKEQKIERLKSGLSNPDERLKQLGQEFAFATTSYAINPDGTVASLTALSRDVVKDYYYTTLLNKNKMFLVVAGNISKEALEKKIQETFAGIPAKDYTPAFIRSPVFNRESSKIENRQTATNYIAGIINAPALNNTDYPAYRLGVTILHSVLYNVIRLNKHLSYAPSATMSEGKISYATMYASTTQPVETVKTMRNVLANLKDKVCSEQLLDNVRKGTLLSYIKRQEVMSSIADRLGTAEIMGDWRLSENLVSRMSVVTPEDVRSVMNVYAKQINWIYIGNQALAGEAFER